MKFNEEKKKAIILYLLEKIDANADNLSKSVSETFGVNQNTIHTYINQLVDDGVIKRVMRGHYELVENVKIYTLNRAKGDLDSDMYAYNAYLKNHIIDLPRNVQEIWEYAFSEMVNNVMDHSQSDDAQIIVSRNYFKTTVIISDNGIGIFEKIKNYFNLDSLDDAICELFKGKLTTDSKNHSGEGIFFTSKIMDEFFVWSSKRVFTCNKYDDSKIEEVSFGALKGTNVFMTLSNFTHKQVKDVFDMYSDVDGGFKKTVIPLRNIFDTSPVSRSQARRVCNRLNDFEEVVLDFQSLDWMGQGFAHQIFVVFASEHPEIVKSLKRTVFSAKRSLGP